jgi:hypothetical protein
MSKQYTTVFEVPPGFKDETPFSPRLEPGTVGIRISVPTEVGFSPAAGQHPAEPFAYVPVSFVYCFSLADWLKFGVIEKRMMVMAVNASTGKSYVGALEQGDIVPAELDYSHVPRARLEQAFNTRYFTANLVELLGLPEEEATYHVHVSLEEHQSNVERVALRKRP